MDHRNYSTHLVGQLVFTPLPSTPLPHMFSLCVVTVNNMVRFYSSRLQCHALQALRISIMLCQERARIGKHPTKLDLKHRDSLEMTLKTSLHITHRTTTLAMYSKKYNLLSLMVSLTIGDRRCHGQRFGEKLVMFFVGNAGHVDDSLKFVITCIHMCKLHELEIRNLKVSGRTDQGWAGQSAHPVIIIY